MARPLTVLLIALTSIALGAPAWAEGEPPSRLTAIFTALIPFALLAFIIWILWIVGTAVPRARVFQDRARMVQDAALESMELSKQHNAQVEQHMANLEQDTARMIELLESIDRRLQGPGTS